MFLVKCESKMHLKSWMEREKKHIFISIEKDKSENLPQEVGCNIDFRNESL